MMMIKYICLLISVIFMKKTEQIVYKGRSFWASGTNPNYFYSELAAEGGKRRKVALHRLIWQEANGCAIPDGCDIHHKDHNQRNNDPSNLEAIPKGKHRSAHRKQQLSDPIFRAANAAALLTAQERAKEWHGSEQGAVWHKQHGLETWAALKPKNKICVYCHEEYETKSIGKADYCSNACWQKLRYANKVDFEARTCVQCGAEFSTRKNSSAKTCSQSCGAKVRWANKLGFTSL